MAKKELKWNDKEKKLLAAFPAPGIAVTIEDLARVCFASVGVASNKRGNSWVRNSLRKPVRLKLVKQVGRGLYCSMKTKTTRSTVSRKATRKNSAAKTSEKKATETTATV